ncbi:MAG: thioredoxin family protein, partial [Anaerolineae bacterium]|nr:thioredoxin family protein [Anaerolineae bacterium]MDW8071197.1 thioredoxin domain-containing protein [Anaerolineae bacterium]
AMTTAIEITDSTFDAQVCKPDIPVLVHFHASWNAMSNAAMPILEQIAREYPYHLKVVRMDVDQNNIIPYQYQVQRVPTFILFVNGQEVARWTGNMSRAELLAQITPYLRLDAVP